MEWVVADTGQDTPELFGEKFDEGQESGRFTLHPWICKTNPGELFNATHPDVTCPANPAH